MNWFCTPLRRELPWFGLQTLLLVVLLHANAPELWFWFLLLLLLLAWRGINCWWQAKQEEG
ncbi:hypothetical protein [Synechococcus sp. UW140]|jgi:hypothetical protein|uniref:hypothetical protein n=1 Tax=Synechococcus sp. UW140 TaxID=368503 RepID=UPI0025D88D5E|nr:hypothetical protein [Synechococcus sp. UW140]